MKKYFPMLSTVLLMVGAAILGATIEDTKFIQMVAMILIFTGGVLTGMDLFKN